MKHALIFSTALIIVSIDQITKFLANIYLQPNQSLPIIKNFLHITYIQNFGAGFGILQHQRSILVFISLIVIGFMLFYLDRVKEKEKLLQILVGFVFGGTVGNLIDRIAFGYVVDFIDFRVWPVFNFADSFVTIGVLGLIVYFWKR